MHASITIVNISSRELLQVRPSSDSVCYDGTASRITAAYLAVCMDVWMSRSLSACLVSVRLSVRLFVCRVVCLSDCLSVCLPGRLFIGRVNMVEGVSMDVPSAALSPLVDEFG